MNNNSKIKVTVILFFIACILTQKLKSQEINNLTTVQSVSYSRLLIALNTKPIRIPVDQYDESSFNELIKEIKKSSLENNGILHIAYYSESRGHRKLNLIGWSIKKRSFIPCANKSLSNDILMLNEATPSNSNQEISIGNLDIGMWDFIVNIKNNNIEFQGKEIIERVAPPKSYLNTKSLTKKST